MTGIPEEAIRVAAKVIACRSLGPDDGPNHAAEVPYTSLARQVLEAAAPHIVYAEVAARVAEQGAVRDDLAALLRLLGLGDHARPQSPREVFRECLAEVGNRIAAARAEGAAAERECIHAAVGELDLSGWSLRGSWVRDRLDEILGVGLVPIRDEDEQVRGTDDH